MSDLLLLINAISEQSSQDELDVLVQADAIERAAKELGHKPRRASFGLNLEPLAQILENHRPDLVFNLVETVGGKGALIHLCPIPAGCFWHSLYRFRNLCPDRYHG